MAGFNPLLRLPFFSTDIPFARDDAHRLLPWVIGLMVCLACLLLSVSISISQAMRHATQDISRSFQVEIPYQQQGQQALATQVVERLKRMPLVASARLLPESELAKLVEPWFGDSARLVKLPMPSVIEARLKEQAPSDASPYEAISRELQGIAPSVRVEGQQGWVGDFSRMASSLQWLLLLLSLLIIASTVVMVVLVARNSLKLHFKTVNILHLIGARDRYILQQFERHGLLIALRGALIGMGFALCCFLIVSMLAARADNPFLHALHFSGGHWLLFFLLPIVVVGLTMLAVRGAIQSMLHHMH